MGKLIFYFIFMSSAYSISPYVTEESLDTIIEAKKFEQEVELNNLFGLSNNKLTNELFKDPKNIVNDKFNIPDFFKSSVNFWFHVYALHDRNTIIIHDRENLELSYETIDFKELRASPLNLITKAQIQNKIALQRIKKYKMAFEKLKNGSCISLLCKNILEKIDNAGIKLSKNNKKNRQFWIDRASKIRIQTGQRDAIEKGLTRFQFYKSTLNGYIDLFKLPKELLAVPFLESSFNTKARSKVGASGPWQFMRFIGSKFMVINKTRDDRVNPIISSLSALHLLKQNHQILKRWDLAITAYNSGTKHLIRARKKFKRRVFPLSRYITDYRSNHVGFASKNFYASFLALTYTLAYSDRLFSNEEFSKTKENKISVYLAKKSFKRKRLYSEFSKNNDQFKELNNHLLKSVTYPRRTIVINHLEMPKNRFKKISDKQLKKYYPKNFRKILK